jgi:hypothetical protein
LNRCFALGDDEQSDGYEPARARELLKRVPKQIFAGGALGRAAYQLLVDCHSSGSNMGVCLMAIAGSTFNLRLAKYLMRKSHSARYPVRLVLSEDPPRAANNNIDSVTPLGIAVEVGPLAHGTMGDLELLDLTREAVMHVLDFVEAENQTTAAQPNPGLDWRHASVGSEVCHVESIVAYVTWKNVLFPVDPVSGLIRAVVHPSLLGRDFEKIQRGVRCCCCCSGVCAAAGLGGSPAADRTRCFWTCSPGRCCGTPRTSPATRFSSRSPHITRRAWPWC